MTTIYEADVIEAAGLKYQIQMQQVSGIWQQRHIWYPAPKTFVDPGTVRVEEWIRSVQIAPDSSFSRVEHATEDR